MEFRKTGWRRYVLVQPPMMVLLLAQSMSGNILTDLIEYRTCRITLGFNETECSLLHENSSSAEALKIYRQVQPQSSLILMSKSFIESILPAFLSFFLGPWSDNHGRRPLILSGCIGKCYIDFYVGISLTFFMLSLMASWDISPWFLLVAYIPSALLGGFCIFLLACICYVSDISNERDRVWHYIWLDISISLGILIGIFVGPTIFQHYGYTAVLGSTTACCTLAVLYIYYVVPETIQSNSSTSVNNIFDINLVKDLVNTCIKKRDGFDRRVVWCCIGCIILIVITMQGEMTIGFLFASARLGWNVREYSNYMAANIIASAVGGVFTFKILKRYAGLSEESTCILAVLSSLGGSLVRSFTWKPWHIYLAVVVELFNGVTTPTIRAILSKAVPSQDVGKVFSLTVSIETLTPFGASSLYSMVYSYCMPPLYPSPVWLVSSGIFAIVILLLINIKIHRARTTVTRCTLLTEDGDVSS